MIDKEEARRLLKAIDICGERLSPKEKKFIIDMIEHPEYELTPGRINYIEIIADRHNIL